MTSRFINQTKSRYLAKEYLCVLSTLNTTTTPTYHYNTASSPSLCSSSLSRNVFLNPAHLKSSLQSYSPHVSRFRNISQSSLISKRPSNQLILKKLPNTPQLTTPPKMISLLSPLRVGFENCYSFVRLNSLPLLPTFASFLAASAGVGLALCESESLDSWDDAPSYTAQAIHKQTYSNYRIIRMPGDGRCLFHAVGHGLSKTLLSNQNKNQNHTLPILSESQRIALADELRNRAADELIKRRNETEWFIEGDFDTYVKNIRKPYVWGGEPEILMLSHALKVPISVFIASPDKNGHIISIADYGLEYANQSETICILYNGSSHYDALEMSHPLPSKL